MRFGKKLALQVMDDQSGAPYLSHKPMKEAINRTVRELRLYQAKCQGSEVVWRGGNLPPGAAAVAMASPAELAEMEERVSTLDRQLFSLVDEDMARILAHIRVGEVRLSARVAAVQDAAREAGLLIDEARLLRLEQALPQAPEDRTVLCRELLQLKLQADPLGMERQLQSISSRYQGLLDVANSHAQYIEINVAGFRKLLKRHEKQIPAKFRSRHMPCLDFHRLVTHTSRQLLDATKQLCGVITDAWERLAATAALGQVARLCSHRPEINEPRGLGPECEMVLHIQRQLKEPMNGQMMQLVASFSGPSPGVLYPKPAVSGRGVSSTQSAFVADHGQHPIQYSSSLQGGSGMVPGSQQGG